VGPEARGVSCARWSDEQGPASVALRPTLEVVQESFVAGRHEGDQLVVLALARQSPLDASFGGARARQEVEIELTP